MAETSSTGKPVAYALLGALLLATIAYWAPWVDHDAAALKLSGQDLGEFVKFLPEIRRGAQHFPRQVFYLPAFTATCALVLLATARSLPYPRWLRVLLLAWAALLLPGLLPPAWGRVRELFAPEFRLQGLALFAGVLLIAAHGLLARLPRAALAAALSGLALCGLLPAQIAFWAIRARIWAAYGTPSLRLGWGLLLHLVAWIALLVLAWATWARPRRTAGTH
ncbi:MAG: hypothetical protein JXA09_01755 [Anaerolineae bacterium]|nr:hypothetical protein [Anaerolineae bacterium]